VNKILVLFKIHLNCVGFEVDFHQIMVQWHIHLVKQIIFIPSFASGLNACWIIIFDSSYQIIIMNTLLHNAIYEVYDKYYQGKGKLPIWMALKTLWKIEHLLILSKFSISHIDFNLVIYCRGVTNILME
jgi:hypothetical protein